jgi:xanthine/CO dehydrogenase XdhC/CoxF family maturation factor
VTSTQDLGRMMEQAESRVQSGERVALVTIVRTRGATPRKVGTKMLVFEDGLFAGTVGGGCGEADVLQETMRVMETGEPSLFHVDLTADEAEESGDVCGGIMDVFIEPWAPSAVAKGTGSD